jgi:hypothetical protein
MALEHTRSMRTRRHSPFSLLLSGAVVALALASPSLGQKGAGEIELKAPTDSMSSSQDSGARPMAVDDKEVPPAASLPCFPGAYYRKVVSSFATWTGITGIVKLGTPAVDMDRLGGPGRQPLDNFSVYMGGNAGHQEVDAGLTWEFTRDEHGAKSKMRNAWRPFWRAGSWNSAPDEKQYYWYPGDVVTMAVVVAGPGRLRLVIADAGQQPKRVFSTEFDAKGFAPRVPRQFKRVNAIDQVGNEGHPIQRTNAHVTGAIWQETYLLRGEGDKAERFPMTTERYTDMRCPAPSVSITTDAQSKANGGETIDIHGTPVNR